MKIREIVARLDWLAERIGEVIPGGHSDRLDEIERRLEALESVQPAETED